MKSDDGTKAADDVRVLVLAGVLGWGIRTEEIDAGLAMASHAIAVNAGSTDSGPAYLATGRTKYGRPSIKRDHADPAISAESIAAIYGVEVAHVKRFEVKSLNMVKISYPRTTRQGRVVERDMHSGQQFVPLLELQLRRNQ